MEPVADGELGLQTSCVFLFFFFNDISFDNLRLWKKETHACPKIPFKKITRSLHQREVSFEESAARLSRRLSSRKQTSPEGLTAVVLPDSSRECVEDVMPRARRRGVNMRIKIRAHKFGALIIRGAQQITE